MKDDAFALIAPFATWMVLMFALPSAPWSYAVRTFATLVVLLYAIYALRHASTSFHHANVSTRSSPLLIGFFAGLLVLILWVLPEKVIPGYATWCIVGGTANAPVDTSAWYWKAIRLFGSAFVISVAEELFFRRWLMRTAGFFWMLALFAVEHDRWLAALITGAIYGWLALRKGLASAIVAHITTNLLLGLYVLATDDWCFW